MDIQVYGSAAEAVSFPVRRTCSSLPLLPSVQSNIQVAGMLPAATQNRHERQLIYFQRQSPAAQSFCGHSLVLSLSSTQQHSAK